jgi:hypothetical protein
MLPTWIENLVAALTQKRAAIEAGLHALFCVIGAAFAGEILAELRNGGHAGLDWAAIGHACTIAGLTWAAAYFKSPSPPDAH